jgi:hypothetical protein
MKIGPRIRDKPRERERGEREEGKRGSTEIRRNTSDQPRSCGQRFHQTIAERRKHTGE